jgi:hypothetical protein
VRARLPFALFAGACLAVQPAAAQEPAAMPGAAPAQPQAPTVSGLTVTAPKPPVPEAKLRPKLEAFVRAYGVPAPLGQLARWREKVCPAVSGASAEDNALVAARIRSVAAEVGAPVADAADCRRTVSVFFSDQPQKVLDVIRDKRPVFLGYHYPSQTRRIATFTGAIRAWYTTATRGAAGQQVIDDTRYLLPGGDADSRLTTGVGSEFAGVVIVADLGKIRGRDMAAVADYVAMLALTETGGEPGCQPLPTIMNLFTADCAAPRPDRLTRVDLAYLEALYTTDSRRVLEVQQADIIAKMKHSLQR